MKNAIIASLVIHFLLLILFSLGIRDPFEKALKDNTPMVIDFVQIAEKSAAPKLSPINQKPDEQKVDKKEEKKIEDTPPPEQPDENVLEEKSQPEPEPVKEEPKPEEQPKEVEPKKEATPVLKKKPEPKKPEPPKKTEPKKTDKKFDPKKDKKDPDKKDKAKEPKKASDKAQVNLNKNKSNKKSDKKPDPKSKKDPNKALNDLVNSVSEDAGNNEEGSPAENVGEVVTATEIDAIRQKIRKCWLVPAGLKDAKDMIVDIKMEIAKDGTVVKAEVVDKGRIAKDSAYRTAAENARRAVLDPACNPLPLSLDKYDQWKDLEMSFNPKDMF